MFSFKIKKSTLLIITFQFLCVFSFAQRMRGGHINWTREPSTRKVNFKVYINWDTNNIGTIYFYNGENSSVALQGVEISSTNFQKTYLYTYSHVYTTNGPFIAYVSGCCISNNIIAFDDNIYGLNTIVKLDNNTVGSPGINFPFFINFYQNTIGQYQLNALAPDGNVVSYSIETFGASYIPRVGGNYAGVSSNGTVTWNTTGSSPNQEYYMKIIMTGYNNVKSELAFTIKIISGEQAPFCYYEGDVSSPIYANKPYSVNVKCIDPEGGILSISNQNLPLGMSNTFNNNFVNYDWVPTSAQGEQTYTVPTIFTDPTNLSTTCNLNLSVIDKRLISCYAFDNNVIDSKGSNNGTLNSGSFLTDRFGQSNNALLLNGSTDFVTIPTTDFSNTSYSFSAWVKPYDLPTNNSLSSRTLISFGNVNNEHSFGFRYDNTSQLPALQLSASGISSMNALISTDFQTGQSAPWKHIVGVVENNKFRYYVDGNLVQSFNTTGNVNYSSPIIGNIGRSIKENQYFHGGIDDLMIIKRGLTEAEILELYHANSSCPNNIINVPIITVKPFEKNTCKGSTKFISFTHSNFFRNEGNFYQIQLSDENGSFSNPIILNNDFYDGGNCVIPQSIPSGNGYLIRVVSTNPSIISSNTQPVHIQEPVTGSLTGSASIPDGTSSTLTLNLTGSFPISYLINNLEGGIAYKSPVYLNVSPQINTTYSINYVSNSCGNGTISGVPTITLTDSKQLISCFPFNGNTKDETGGNDGTLYGPTLTVDRKGFSNSAYNFDGNDFINFNNWGIVKSNYTISAWVKIQGLPTSGNTAAILSITSYNGETLQQIAIKNNASTNNQPAWFFTSSYGYNSFNFTYNSSDIQINRWYHVVAVRSRTDLKLFINGVQVSSVLTNNLPAYNDASPYVVAGATFENGSSTKFFNGIIDDIKLFKGELSNSEIEELSYSDYCQYSSDNRQIELISCYKFDGNADDSKGNNHGTVNGALLANDRFGNQNAAFTFNGNDYIYIPNRSIDRNYSVSLWVNIRTLPNSNYPVRTAFRLGGSYDKNLNLIFDGQKVIWKFENSYNGNMVPTSTKATIINQWNHIVVVVEGETVRLYINGQFEGTETGVNANYISYCCGPEIGRGGTNSYFDGIIDDIKYFRGALNSSEILKLFNMEVISPVLCSFLPCNPSVVKNITDGQSANASHFIIAQNTIPSSSNILFEAGKSIILKPGFQTNNQSVFHAKIGGCQ